ncbi:unnamed protein product, partial [Didymodactylos carnosus]
KTFLLVAIFLLTLCKTTSACIIWNSSDSDIFRIQLTAHDSPIINRALEYAQSHQTSPQLNEFGFVIKLSSGSPDIRLKNNQVVSSAGDPVHSVLPSSRMIKYFRQTAPESDIVQKSSPSLSRPLSGDRPSSGAANTNLAQQTILKKPSSSNTKHPQS